MSNDIPTGSYRNPSNRKNPFLPGNRPKPQKPTPPVKTAKNNNNVKKASASGPDNNPTQDVIIDPKTGEVTV